MVDGRRFHLFRPRRCRQHQQGEAVRSAGHGHANARMRRDQRIKVAAKAIEDGCVHSSPLSFQVHVRAGGVCIQYG